MAGLIPLAGGAVIWRVIDMRRHTDNFVRDNDNNLPGDVIQDVIVHMPDDPKDDSVNSGGQDDRHPGWRLTEDARLKPTGDINPKLMELELVRDFNMRPDKYNSRKGFLYLANRTINNTVRPVIRINKYYFRVALPFSDREIWTGTVLADTRPPMPTLCALSRKSQHSYCLSLSEEGSGKSEQCAMQSSTAEGPASITSLQGSGPLISDSDIVCRDDKGSPIFSVRRKGDQIMMSGYSGVVIRQDGESYKWGMPLKPQAVIDVVSTTNPTASQNLIYLAAHPDTVAFSQ